jgi:hypothetical protein
MAVEKPEITYKVFQFPANMIPRIDANVEDWNIVPEDYVIGTDQLTDTLRHNTRDPKNLDVQVRVGWVKGLNRLYFLYEAYDDYWDFARDGLSQDIFELVVDGDLSGGPLIEQARRDVWSPEAVGAMSVLDKRLDPGENYWATHGVHAQNYHIFTPAQGKDWAMAWGCQPYIKALPYANAAYNYDFKNGEPGKLVLEFWITPFDYAGCEGPQRSVESVLWENKLMGLSWAVIDYDGRQGGFWNLSPKQTMFGNASQLCAFRLMPLETSFRKPIAAQWSFLVVDMSRRLVAFKDLSEGNITSWRWEFGDGATSAEKNPNHAYPKPGDYVVSLTVEGPEGKSRMQKVWDVTLR